MATVTHLGTATVDTTAGNRTVTATPAVNDLIVIVCANTGRTSAQPPVVTDNNSSGTYARINVSGTKNTSADSLWIFVRNTKIGSASSTIFTATTASDSGGAIDVFNISGMTLVSTAAVRAVGKQDNQASATPAPVFPQAALTGNPCIGAIFNATSPATMTAPATWTEATDLGYSVPTTGFESVFVSSGFTSATVTWGSSSASAFCSLIIELDATSGVVPLPRKPVSQSVNRKAYW
jgi:hypothetical protein